MKTSFVFTKQYNTNFTASIHKAIETPGKRDAAVAAPQPFTEALICGGASTSVRPYRWYANVRLT